MTKTLLLITGASRGLGRAFAKQLVRQDVSNHKLHPTGTHTIHALLVARSKQELLETESIMKQQLHETKQNTSETKLQVSSHVMDLSNLNTLEQNIKELFSDIQINNNDKKDETYEKAILINNAGSIGYVGPLRDLTSLQQMQEEINFNVTSSLWLSSQFAKFFQMTDTKSTIIVNISSLCAIQPFPTMGLYCVGKAARDMFHHTLAVEQQDEHENNPHHSSIKVLNYAPGACDTNMCTMLQTTSQELDPKLRDFYQTSKQNKTLVQPDDSAQQLAQLILSENFESSAHVDYWDLVSPPPCSSD